MTIVKIWLLTIVATFAGGCQPPAADAVITGRTMGTSWVVHLGHCPAGDCETALTPLIETRLQELSKVFSHYDPASELSAFNAYRGSDWFSVSADMTNVVQLASTISALSNGAFDITVAPAVDAWGFGAAAHDGQAPDDIEIRRAIKHTGYQMLSARERPPALQKAAPEVQIDTSAIAKGYAVDQLAYLLEGEGIVHYLVDIGGEVRTSGTRSDGQAWRIGIEPPNIASNAAPTIEFVVTPGSMAVATSGDYRNFYMLDEQRISHTINPTTGQPLNNGVAAVSVIAPSAAQADALATALMVLGPDEGMALAEREQLAALFSLRKNGRLHTQYTAAFAAYLLKN